jgi:serine/threonine protein kinase
MGVVYEAFDRERKETVALKTLRDVDPVSLYRFKQEFRSLAELSHPNLVPLYELVAGDAADGATDWFFTMELVEGAMDFRGYLGAGLPEPHDSGSDETTTDMRTRQDVGAPGLDATVLTTHGPAGTVTSDAPEAKPAGGVLPAMRVDAARLRPLLQQLALGVQALHDAGKLHRDLKPSNVLVRPDGRVLLVDFGLVAELSDAPTPSEIQADVPAGSPSRLSHQSTDRGLAGTIGFMSPEQAGRRPLTPASDWYAIGVMLFSALTGRLPFTGQAMAVLQGKQEREAPRPSEFAAGIPDDLEALCVDLLRLRPADRPAGAEVLARLGVTADAGRSERLPFIGRERHLAALDAAYARLRGGDTVVCHVHGRSGAGKSALVSRFLAGLTGRAEAPVVLVGRCYEQESVPYKAIDSLVDALTHHLLGVPHEVSKTLVPPQAAELTRVFPVLNRVEAFARASRRSRASTDPRETRAFAFAGLRELLRRLGERAPLVLCIDDVQWGDGDSADLLAGLVAAPGAPRLLLLLSYRDEYATTSLCLQRLGGQPGTQLADALCPIPVAGSAMFLQCCRYFELYNAANVAGATFPPLTMATTGPDAVIRPDRMAAVVAAPLGSTTCLAS